MFVLIYTPCVATLAAIKSEFGWRWAAFSGLYQFGLAWLLAVVVFQVGIVPGVRLMLRAILSAIREAGRPMCLADLSRELGIDESALEGMLETLVARGRLRAIVFDDEGCTACPIKSGCFIMNDGVAMTYALLPGPVTVAAHCRPSASAPVPTERPRLRASDPTRHERPTRAASPSSSPGRRWSGSGRGRVGPGGFSRSRTAPPAQHVLPGRSASRVQPWRRC